MIFNDMKISHSTVRELVRSILTEASKRLRPPGYEEALRDTSRSVASIARDFSESGINAVMVSKDRNAIGIRSPRARPPGERPEGYEEAIKDRSISANDIVTRFGVSLSAVYMDRSRLGDVIPHEAYAEDLAKTATPVSHASRVQKGGRPVKEMPSEYYAMLGQAPIRVIADTFGVSETKVSADMYRLEIPQFGRGRPVKEMPQAYYDSLGKMSDLDVVNAFNVSNAKVLHDRTRLGIAPYSAGALDMPPEYYAALGKATDTEIADAFGVSRPKVSYDREAAGIEPVFYTGQVLDPDTDRRLGPRK